LTEANAKPAIACPDGVDDQAATAVQIVGENLRFVGRSYLMVCARYSHLSPGMLAQPRRQNIRTLANLKTSRRLSLDKMVSARVAERMARNTALFTRDEWRTIRSSRDKPAFIVMTERALCQAATKRKKPLFEMIRRAMFNHYLPPWSVL
jgi:hypothetical protein